MAGYPKKYWWLVLIVVPLAVAVIQLFPHLMKNREAATYISSTEFSGDMHFTNVSVIQNEYKTAREEPLTDPNLKGKLEEATNLVKAGDYDAALPLFEELAKALPLPSVYSNLGVLYALKQNYAAAQQAYSKALKLDPAYQPAHLNEALLDEHQGKLDEALGHLEKASDLTGADTLAQAVREVKAQDIHSREIEPNDDILKPNAIPLNTWVPATIASASDGDYFTFTTLSQYRDIIRVEVE